jgi:tRNA G18 (ribose-2'-O)-methylase SpoU
MGLEQWWGRSDREWTLSGLTLAEGATLVERLLASPLEPEGVFCLAAHEAAVTPWTGGRCPVTVLTEAEMHRWAGFPFHRGIVAIARRPAPLTLEAFLVAAPAPGRLAVAPRLTDPENLGSIFRSAVGLGWSVAVGPASCDPYSRRCAKVSMGAVYAHPPVQLTDDTETTRLLAGWTNLALSLEGGAAELETWVSEAGDALSGPVSLWVGNEFEGLDVRDRAVCGRAVVIPMAPGHDSLNAAVAAGIALYRLRSSTGKSLF